MVIPELLALNNINSVIRTMVPVNILVNILGSTIVAILTNYGSMIFPGIAKVTLRAGSSARGIESVWDGLVKDCETSLVRNMAPDEVCPAAPSAATKTMKVGSLRHRFSSPNLTVAIHGGFHKWGIHKMDPPSNFSYVKGRTWATVQNASQQSFCTKRRSWDHLFVFAFIV